MPRSSPSRACVISQVASPASRTVDSVLVRLGPPRVFANPKSMTFAWPLGVTMMLLLLMSRWTIPLLWASAKVQVPFYPVPMTLQTLVVLALAMAYGWRLALATLLVYFAQGALGLPVFAGTPEKGIGSLS